MFCLYLSMNFIAASYGVGCFKLSVAAHTNLPLKHFSVWTCGVTCSFLAFCCSQKRVITSKLGPHVRPGPGYISLVLKQEHPTSDAD